jgi:hypothetical protein
VGVGGTLAGKRRNYPQALPNRRVCRIADYKEGW